MNPPGSRLRWFVPADLNGFFGLLVDKWRWFLPAILALMLAEWLLRRRMNLI